MGQAEENAEDGAAREGGVREDVALVQGWTCLGEGELEEMPAYF